MTQTVLRNGFALSVTMLVCSAGCELPEYAYRGTGALQATGAASTTLASSTVAVAVCPGDSQATPPTATFTIMRVGPACTLTGWGNVEDFRPPIGSSCSLAFADGTRTLRVTDVVAHYGAAGARRLYEDATYIDLALGGDDTRSGQHALYHFTGRLTGETASPQSTRCDPVREKLDSEAGRAGGRT